MGGFSSPLGVWVIEEVPVVIYLVAVVIERVLVLIMEVVVIL